MFLEVTRQFNPRRINLEQTLIEFKTLIMYPAGRKLEKVLLKYLNLYVYNLVMFNDTLPLLLVKVKEAT